MLIVVILIMVSIIRFSDIDRWRLSGRWIFVYGRKTGKTYFIRNHVKCDKYFFVSRSRDFGWSYDPRRN